VAGIIDEIGLVEQINELLGLPHQEKVSAPNPRVSLREIHKNKSKCLIKTNNRRYGEQSWN
jgi:hypothetical protein